MIDDSPLTSLFGGEFEVGGLVDDPRELLIGERVPNVKLPTYDSREVFTLCWERFHYLKGLTLAAVGRSIPTGELTALHVPWVVSIHFGAAVMNAYRTLANAFYDDAGPDGTVVIPDWWWEEAHLEATLETSYVGLYATQFFIEAPLASQILRMRPPDTDLLADLRLPDRRVVIVLGAGFEITPDLGWWTEDETAEAQMQDIEIHAAYAALGVREISEEKGGALNVYRPSLKSQFLAKGGRIRGVLLSSDGNGFLEDHVTWLIETLDDDPTHGLVSGKISRSRLAPLVYNLAGTVAWAKWSHPDPDTTRPIPMTWQELDKKPTGATRRALQHPQNLGIRVIDLPATRARSRSAAGEPTGRTVAAHMRRGHWHAFRIANRDEDGNIVGDRLGERDLDWHYDVRPMLPLLINASSIDDIPGVRVYRIPHRKEFEE